MNISTRMVRWLFWPIAVVLVLSATVIVWYYSQPPRGRGNSQVNAAGNEKKDEQSPDDPADPQEPGEPVAVKYVHPRKGALERVTVVPGSVQAYEVNLYASVSGYLKSLGKNLKDDQEVDRGSRVGANQVLAIVEVPELEKQVDRNSAVVEQAQARVGQMKAKVGIAKAELEIAKAQVFYAEANSRAATAWVSYRRKSYQRMKDLYKETSIEERLVDEYKERYEAARESESAAQAAILTSKAQTMLADAKIALTEADVAEALTQVKIAKAELEKTQVELAYAKVKSPFEGNITERFLTPGDFVRSAREGGTPVALFAIQRTDLMRVVVQIPDRDVPYADPGDSAIVEIDAFPDKKFPAKLSRIAKSEDPRTHMMPAEIDMKNPDGLIRQGMFGRVTIILDKGDKMLSIDAKCLVGKYGDGRGTVFVVGADNKAHRKVIKIGMDNGKRVEVRNESLKDTDKVVYDPRTLTENTEVDATFLDEGQRLDVP